MTQLVLQLSPWGAGIDSYDRLIAMESALVDALAAEAEVDGHDMGSNEANVFIFTNRADETFTKCLPVVTQLGLLNRLSAGYRTDGNEEYIRVWPQEDGSPFTVK